jgi:hypothetical protein
METVPVLTRSHMAQKYSLIMFNNSQYNRALQQSLLSQNQQPWLLCAHIDFSSAHSRALVRGLWLVADECDRIHGHITMNKRRCVPSKRLEAITLPHGATTQNTRLLNTTTTGLQMIKSFSTWSFTVGSAVSFPHDLIRVFRRNPLSLSLSLSLFLSLF